MAGPSLEEKIYYLKKWLRRDGLVLLLFGTAIVLGVGAGVVFVKIPSLGEWGREAGVLTMGTVVGALKLSWNTFKSVLDLRDLLEQFRSKVDLKGANAMFMELYRDRVKKRAGK